MTARAPLLCGNLPQARSRDAYHAASRRYLSGLKQRLQWALYSRAGAIAAFALLLVLCGAIAWLAPQGFPRYGVIASRLVLVVLIAAGVFFLWRSFKHLTDRAGATALEQVLPQQRGRVQTYIELQAQKASGASAPMLISLLPMHFVSQSNLRSTQSLPRNAFGLPVVLPLPRYLR